MKGELVLGFYEDNDDFNAYLNKEFLLKFDINIYCTYIELDKKVNIIYGIPITLSNFKNNLLDIEYAKINKFIKYMKDKYNMDYRSPFVTSVIDWYNTSDYLKNKTEIDIDYTYDRFNGKEVKKYYISGTMYFKNNLNEDSDIVENIFQMEAFNYGYKYEWFQLDNDSAYNSYWMDICILITGDIEEWINKIKENTEEYVWYEGLKYSN